VTSPVDPSALAVRPLEPRDIDAVLAIQVGLPQISQWSAADYDLARHTGTAGWIAEVAGEISGFIVVRQAADEAEILNLAVHVFHRRTGIGTSLLDTALEWAAQRGAAKIYLEVRASNRAALKFYEHHRFVLAGRRTRYYASPTEDALVLARDLAQH
jgi:[ribosomal protein S18]-alanine N-acetyltransferase